MKYIIETDALLSDMMIASLKQVSGMAHIESIEPLRVSEEELDEFAYIDYNNTACFCAEDGFIKGFKSGYKKALGI